MGLASIIRGSTHPTILEDDQVETHESVLVFTRHRRVPVHVLRGRGLGRERPKWNPVQGGLSRLLMVIGNGPIDTPEVGTKRENDGHDADSEHEPAQPYARRSQRTPTDIDNQGTQRHVESHVSLLGSNPAHGPGAVALSSGPIADQSCSLSWTAEGFASRSGRSASARVPRTPIVSSPSV